jgi:hypothetical protein
MRGKNREGLALPSWTAVMSAGRKDLDSTLNSHSHRTQYQVIRQFVEVDHVSKCLKMPVGGLPRVTSCLPAKQSIYPAQRHNPTYAPVSLVMRLVCICSGSSLLTLRSHRTLVALWKSEAGETASMSPIWHSTAVSFRKLVVDSPPILFRSVMDSKTQICPCSRP